MQDFSIIPLTNMYLLRDHIVYISDLQKIWYINLSAYVYWWTCDDKAMLLIVKCFHSFSAKGCGELAKLKPLTLDPWTSWFDMNLWVTMSTAATMRQVHRGRSLSQASWQILPHQSQRPLTYRQMLMLAPLNFVIGTRKVPEFGDV